MAKITTQQEAQLYAQSLTPEKLVEALNKLDNAYYNKKQIVRDDLYDVMREVAQSRQHESKLVVDYLKKIGHKPSKDFEKLPYRMPSLDKIKPGTGEVAKFAAKSKGPFVLIDKEDGVSLLSLYKDHNLPNCFTRGTDDEGQNVNRLRPHLDIPKALDVDLAVRQEMLIPLSTFVSKYADKFENPRNMTIGVTGRLRGDNSAAKDIHVLAYGILNKRLKPSSQLSLLKKLGFKVPHYEIVESIDDTTLSQYFAKRKKASPYEIDGIVVHHDIIVPQEESGNPKYSVAFKVNTSDEMKDAIVTGIEWQVSKHGKINPVITIEPTRLKGVTISNITGHNAFFITHGFKYADRNLNTKNKPIGKGAIIRISRSGDVIPKVEQVIKPSKPNMPTVPYEWDENGVAIYATGDVSDEDIVLKQLLHFFSTLDIEGMKEATIRLLYDNGYDDIPTILTMDKDDYLALPRIQSTMATKLYTNVRNGVKNCPVEKMVDASSLFGEGMGERRAKVVFTAYPDILSMDKNQAYSNIMDLPGFNVKTATQFVQGLPKFAKFIKKIGYSVVIQKKSSNSLNKLKVCFTGIRNKAVEEFLTTNGGTVASGVAKGLTILVCKNPKENSQKLNKARELEIPIMTLAEFCSKFKIPL